MDLAQIEKELKKRWEYPYRWGRKQNDDWDSKTNFIYRTKSFKELLSQMSGFENPLKDYALNRWYNFLSAKAVEHIFTSHEKVVANKDIYDKNVDFKICDIPFDHKTSVFPKGFEMSLEQARNEKNELALWFYNNQSNQGRQHFYNRLFIVLYDSINQEHWKMKAEISLLQRAIEKYLADFSEEKLLKLKLENREVLSDIIWVEK